MPDWRPEIRRRLATIELRPTREMEIVEEIGQHLEDRWTSLRALGASDDDAIAAAWRELATRTHSAVRFPELNHPRH